MNKVAELFPKYAVNQDSATVHRQAPVSFSVATSPTIYVVMRIYQKRVRVNMGRGLYSVCIVDYKRTKQGFQFYRQ